MSTRAETLGRIKSHLECLSAYIEQDPYVVNSYELQIPDSEVEDLLSILESEFDIPWDKE